VSLDLRGHGESEWAPDGDYEAGTFAADLAAVASGFRHRPSLVGASLGGLCALLALGENPQLARALILVDVVPRMEPAGVDRIVSFMQARPDGFASLEEAGEAIAHYLPQRPRPVDREGLAKNLRLGVDGRWRWHWDPLFVTGRRVRISDMPERLREAARRLRLPTLLVRGRMSDLVSPEGVRDFLELAPHSQLVDVSGAGHMVAGDRNDLFTEAVIRFLGDAPSGP
jgi:pimeloyl-ACP methyl ester carboxylesterase